MIKIFDFLLVLVNLVLFLVFNSTLPLEYEPIGNMLVAGFFVTWFLLFAIGKIIREKM